MTTLHPKVTAGALAGAVVGFTTSILFHVWGIKVPPDMIAPGTVLISFIAGYFTPS